MLHLQVLVQYKDEIESLSLVPAPRNFAAVTFFGCASDIYLQAGHEHALPRQLWQHSHDGFAAGASECERHEVSGIRNELRGGKEASRPGYAVSMHVCGVVRWSDSSDLRRVR